ncbi:MAG: response regulator transcription factor [Clostridia bacterium]|nr:response regulator transcription factor [Clostridia bacterium]
MANELILCVDDEAHILELLTFNLEATGYRVVTTANGEDALTVCQHDRPALILLDLMLPGIDGVEVCRRLKSQTNTQDIPIIMLTAKGDEVDKILGLELGADDYITKPFSVRELVARVKALLRRAATQNDDEGILHVGSITIDPSNYEAHRNGEKLSLTLKEFELLKLLVISRGKVLTRDFLLDRIWGYEFYGETRTVDVHIRHIRQKLGDDAHYIETIRGVGYKFNDKQDNRA